MNAFEHYAAINKQRAMRWHRGGLDEWSVTDWATALAGEVGELCNAIKKYRRVEDQIQGHDGDTPQPQDVIAAIRAIKKEIGDTYGYLDLTAQRFELSVWECARDTFNQISVREGMPERMPPDFVPFEVQEIRRAAEAIAMDRDFVVHSNHVTESAIQRILQLAGAGAQK